MPGDSAFTRGIVVLARGSFRNGGFASKRDAREALERARTEKLRWLLTKAVSAFGDVRVGVLRSQEIAAWPITIPHG